MKKYLYNHKKLKLWLLLGGTTIFVTMFMDRTSMPAPYMIGAMLTGIFFVSFLGDLKLDHRCANFSQAVVGLFIGSSIHLEMISDATVPFYISLLIVLTVLVFSLITGIAVMRSKLLPDSTGLWGALPGAAPMMIIMSEQQGANPSLVAFIQYTRVVLVALLASIITHNSNNIVESGLVTYFEPTTIKVLAIIASSMIFAQIINSPAANFVTPIVLASVLNFFNIPVHAPDYLLKIGFIILGWSVGLRFTAQIRYAARKSFLRVIIMLSFLVGSCYAIGHLLVLLFKIDPLTAYLATSPGGVDSIVVIASGTSADISFVITVQMIRFLILLIWGPLIVRTVFNAYNYIFSGIKRVL